MLASLHKDDLRDSPMCAETLKEMGNAEMIPSAFQQAMKYHSQRDDEFFNIKGFNNSVGNTTIHFFQHLQEFWFAVMSSRL